MSVPRNFMWWYLVNFTLRLLYPGQKHPGVNLITGWMSPTAGRDETRDTFSIGDWAVPQNRLRC